MIRFFRLSVAGMFTSMAGIILALLGLTLTPFGGLLMLLLLFSYAEFLAYLEGLYE